MGFANSVENFLLDNFNRCFPIFALHSQSMRILGSMGTVLAISLLVILVSCKEPKDNAVSQTISFVPKYGNESLVFNKVYGTSAGDSVRISTMKIYLSDVELLKTDGGTQLLTNLLYFSQPGVLSAQTLEVPEGNYTGIRFNFGLTELQNRFDSTTLPCPHPLCADNDMWWDETLKYTFVKLDGHVKLSGNSEFKSLVYHVGTAPYMRTITVEHPIIVSDNTSLGAIVLNIQEIIDGANPMNMNTENISETFDKPAVAEKFADNIVNAFSVE